MTEKIPHLIEQCTRLTSIDFPRKIPGKEISDASALAGLPYIAALWLNPFLRSVKLDRTRRTYRLEINMASNILQFSDLGPTTNSPSSVGSSSVESQVIDRLEICCVASKRFDPGFALQSTSTRLPPVKVLKLERYDWKHTPEELENLWDFSELCQLDLSCLSIPGLSSIFRLPMVSFPKLQSLTIEYYTLGYLNQADESATQECLLAFCGGLNRLQTLDVKAYGWSSLVTPPMLSKVGSTLRKLRLTDPIMHQAVRPRKMKLLLQDCDHIEDLQLDVDSREMKVSAPLGVASIPSSVSLVTSGRKPTCAQGGDARLMTTGVFRTRSALANRAQDTTEALIFLASLGSVQRLTLYFLRVYITKSLWTGDRNHDWATSIMQFIHSQRPGKAFEEISVHCVNRNMDDSQYVHEGADKERVFHSRVSDSGKYLQWGDERIVLEPEKVQVQGEDAEDDMGHSDAADADGADEGRTGEAVPPPAEN